MTGWPRLNVLLKSVGIICVHCLYVILGINVVVVVVVELLFISRFRLRPLMGTRQERPGI